MLSQYIEQLIGVGLTELEIAKRVRTSQPTINRIRRGASTSYELGRRIEALHRDRFPEVGNATQAT